MNIPGQLSICVPVSTEQTRSIQGIAKVLLQPLPKLSYTLQVHAQENPFPRSTAAAHGGTHLVEWHTGWHLLGAVIYLFPIPSPWCHQSCRDYRR